MLYLGIDLHSEQLTLSLRDEEGEALLRLATTRFRQLRFRSRGIPGRKVSSRWLLARRALRSTFRADP
jgi:hypothetical protein